jgi:Restriction endonuclease BamHI
MKVIRTLVVLDRGRIIDSAEWEKIHSAYTDAIRASSHRSMNKLCLALMTLQIEIGVLIVPSRALYPHLTDRIGNWMELSPYLHFWKRAGEFIKKGLLAVTVVEHDELTDDPSIPYIGQGKDGRSAEGKTKSK